MTGSAPFWRRPLRQPSVIPGFGLTLGYAVTCLSLIVLLPLATLVVRASGLGPSGIWAVATDPRVASALRVSFSLPAVLMGLAIPGLGLVPVTDLYGGATVILSLVSLQATRRYAPASR